MAPRHGRFNSYLSVPEFASRCVALLLPGMSTASCAQARNYLQRSHAGNLPSSAYPAYITYNCPSNAR
jgi:hypothetical protein